MTKTKRYRPRLCADCPSHRSSKTVERNPCESTSTGSKTRNPPSGVSRSLPRSRSSFPRSLPRADDRARPGGGKGARNFQLQNSVYVPSEKWVKFLDTPKIAFSILDWARPGGGTVARNLQRFLFNFAVDISQKN